MPKFKNEMNHMAEIQKTLFGEPGAPEHLHPVCNGCSLIAILDRLERIAQAIEQMAKTAKPL